MKRWSTLAMLVAVLLAGCTTFRRLSAVDTEQLLTEAGFTRQPADLATLPPYKVVRQDRDGRVRYVYADPDACTCVYVGDGHAYSVYRRLSLERRIAADRAWAAGQGGQAP
jgi:hypothetical protein